MVCPRLYVQVFLYILEHKSEHFGLFGLFGQAENEARQHASIDVCFDVGNTLRLIKWPVWV
jgi:hypothetical protein